MLLSQSTPMYEVETIEEAQLETINQRGVIDLHMLFEVAETELKVAKYTYK